MIDNIFILNIITDNQARNPFVVIRDDDEITSNVRRPIRSVNRYQNDELIFEDNSNDNYSESVDLELFSENEWTGGGENSSESDYHEPNEERKRKRDKNQIEKRRKKAESNRGNASMQSSTSTLPTGEQYLISLRIYHEFCVQLN